MKNQYSNKQLQTATINAIQNTRTQNQESIQLSDDLSQKKSSRAAINWLNVPVIQLVIGNSTAQCVAQHHAANATYDQCLLEPSERVDGEQVHVMPNAGIESKQAVASVHAQ